MESHLAQLEDDASRGGASPSEATRRAEAKFGNAADHFREALDEWTRRQRTVRNGLIGITIAALVVSAAGIVINVRLLGDLRATLDGWSARAKQSELGFGVVRYSGALVETAWMSPHGVVRQQLPMLLTDWESSTARFPMECAEGERPRFEFFVTEEARGFFEGIPVGTKMSCKLAAQIDLDWSNGTPPVNHSDWLRAIDPSLQFAGCER